MCGGGVGWGGVCVFVSLHVNNLVTLTHVN